MSSKDRSQTPETQEPTSASVEAEVERITNATARELAKQQRVSVMIPLIPGMARDKQPDETVQVNGYTYLIQRGKRVDVPQTVADILREAGLTGEG